MHANYLLAESRTVTPQATADISMHIQARIQTHMPACTLPATRTHIQWLSCSSSTHLLNTGTFTIETSEHLVDKLEGIPLTKEPVNTVCRLMIDYIHRCAGRAEHSTSSVTILNCRFLPKRLTAFIIDINWSFKSYLCYQDFYNRRISLSAVTINEGTNIMNVFTVPPVKGWDILDNRQFLLLMC